MAKIDAAKRSGQWTKLDAVEAAVEALEVPPDLAAALQAMRPPPPIGPRSPVRFGRESFPGFR